MRVSRPFRAPGPASRLRAGLLAALVAGLVGAAALGSLGALAGCEAPGAPAASPGASGTPAPAGPLAIADLTLDSEYVIASEVFGAKISIVSSGTRMITAYGLASRFGRKVYALRYAMPVVDGGWAQMQVGPIPDVKKVGALDFEFWLIDSAGTESNHLTGKMVVQ